jgi:hypothetical protein
MTVRLVYTQVLIHRTVLFCNFSVIIDELMTADIICGE